MWPDQNDLSISFSLWWMASYWDQNSVMAKHRLMVFRVTFILRIIDLGPHWAIWLKSVTVNELDWI